MTIISELENKEFKSFLDAFYNVYHNPPQSKDDKAEQEVWEALERFQQLFRDEAAALVRSPDSVSTGVPSYIKVARENPLVLYFCAKNYLKFDGFAVSKKNPITSEDLQLKKLFSLAYSAMTGPDTDDFRVSCAFAVFPEFKTDPFLLFEFINGYIFQEVYLFYKQAKINLSPDMVNNLMLSLLQNFKIDKINHGIGRVQPSKNLHFLLSEGLRLPAGDKGEQWFRHLPWEEIRDHQIFFTMSYSILKLIPESSIY